jgi:hypothetical protein
MSMLDLSPLHDPDLLQRLISIRFRGDPEQPLFRFSGDVVSGVAMRRPERPARRQRKPSGAALVRQWRKAGERGPITVRLPDGTSITSEREAAIEASDDSPNEWDRLQ